MTEPDWKAMYEWLSDAFERVSRVQRGECPNCGAIREDNDCKACGHHSTYLDPALLARGAEPL